jgi:hypothetical protein
MLKPILIGSPLCAAAGAAASVAAVSARIAPTIDPRPVVSGISFLPLVFGSGRSYRQPTWMG